MHACVRAGRASCVVAVLSVGLVGCRAPTRTPEGAARAYIEALGTRDIQQAQALLTAADAAHFAPDTSRSFLPLGGPDYVAVTVDSARRLAVPAGDTAVVVVVYRTADPDALDRTIGDAYATGLVRDSLSLPAFLAAELPRLPRRVAADTHWVVRTADGWRVWAGMAARSEVERLDAVVRGHVPVPPMAARRRAATALRELLALPPAVLPLDVARREAMHDAIRDLDATVPVLDSLQLTVEPSPSGVSSLLLIASGLPRTRVFAVHFHVRDAAGGWSTRMSARVLGTDRTRVTLPFTVDTMPGALDREPVDPRRLPLTVVPVAIVEMTVPPWRRERDGF